MNSRGKTFIWAHRGASGHEVDNTLEAFELAIEMGADGLESDAYLTRDKELVLYHEDKIAYQGKPYALTQLTLKKIQEIRLKNGRKVPLVRDIFAHFRDRRNYAGDPITYSLDIKTIGMGDYLIDLASKMGLAERITITANDNYPNFWKKMSLWRTQSPNLHLVDTVHFDLQGLKRMFGKMYDQNWAKFAQYNVEAINIKAEYVTPAVLEEMRKRNLNVYVWNCHDEATLRKFYNLEVDAIYTNFPDLAVKIRNEIQK